MVNLDKGTALGSGSHLGVVLLRLGIDHYPTVHEVALHAFAQMGSPIEVLALTIGQLITARDALERIGDGDKLDEVEQNAFEVGVDAGALGMVKPGKAATEELERRRDMD